VEIVEHIAALRDEGPRLAAAAAAAGPGASVPSCPDWAVRDLVRHQGGVHRWATRIITHPLTQAWHPDDLEEVAGSWPPDGELVDWFSQGHADLVSALQSADEALACWTFLAAPSPLAMWARRQAHETAIHRADAELAAGWPVTTLAGPFAADGIDELLTRFITRRAGALTEPAPALGVRCTDTAGEWLVQIGPDRFATSTGGGCADRSDCQVTGRASDLYLALWNRAPWNRAPWNRAPQNRAPQNGQPDGTLLIDGDEQILRQFSDRVQVVWG
jgi:uncharacterized protein (TIGR03083 family)